jgi:hypothetical protein
MSFLTLREELLAEHGVLVGAIRASLGVASNFADVYRLLCFLQGFTDRTADEVGRAGAGPGPGVDQSVRDSA